MTGLAAMAVNSGIRAHAGQGAQADCDAFDIRLIDVDGQRLLVGHRPGDRKQPPLLMFNGIGGNIELLAPLAEALSRRELIIFDVPGVGGSPMLNFPYRMSTIAKLGEKVLAHFNHSRADVFGISWGGGVAQEFARLHPQPDQRPACQHQEGQPHQRRQHGGQVG